jgi:hypothetical protein
MKQLVLIAGIAAICCCSSKKTTGNFMNDNTADESSTVTKNEKDTIPVCIKKLIASFKKEEKQNPPRSVYSYTYNGKTVYYVPPICCDFFSDLYDEHCNIIAHPDGGFTGRGDGKLPDFRTARTNEKLIWHDKRGDQ